MGGRPTAEPGRRDRHGGDLRRRGNVPTGARHALEKVAEEIAAKSGVATFTRGIAAGTLLTLLSYLLHAVNSVGSRIALAYFVGFFLALGPFDHVVVSALHLLFGVWLGAPVGYGDVGLNIVRAGAGNLVGGLLPRERRWSSHSTSRLPAAGPGKDR